MTEDIERLTKDMALVTSTLLRSLRSNKLITDDLEIEIPEEISGMLDIGLEDARKLIEWYERNEMAELLRKARE